MILDEKIKNDYKQNSENVNKNINAEMAENKNNIV